MAGKRKLVCNKCDCTIPIRGFVWRERARTAQYDEQGVSRDYYCDPCADTRESGGWH